MVRRCLSDQEVAHAIGMLHGATSQSDVARHFRVNRSVIHRAFRRFQETGQYSVLPRSGRPRVTTQTDDRFLVLSARRQRFVTARTLQNDLQAATGLRVSTQTIRNRLHQGGLHARIPAIRIPLDHRQCQARLNWARQHSRWTANQWRHVVFSDESRFCLDFNDGRRRVWRHRAERFADCAIAEHDRYGGASLMVWAGIWTGGRTDLHVFRMGTVNAQRYLDEVIRPLVIPQMRQLGAEFIFMHDNAPCHRANIVSRELDVNNIMRLPWPARSPDLNPIEQAWDMLGTAIHNISDQPQTLVALENALRAQWMAIPQNDLNRLIASVRRRVQTCIDAAGGHTRY